jgi:hypothetical protein
MILERYITPPPVKAELDRRLAIRRASATGERLARMEFVHAGFFDRPRAERPKLATRDARATERMALIQETLRMATLLNIIERQLGREP